MKKRIILMIFLPCYLYAEAENVFVATKETKSCYKMTVTTAVQSCMAELAFDKETELNRVHGNFVDRLASEKDKIENYTVLILSVEKSKIKYSEYAKSQCEIYAASMVDKSPAMHIAYNHCLVTLYEKRMKFYKDFAF